MKLLTTEDIKPVFQMKKADFFYPNIKVVLNLITVKLNFCGLLNRDQND